jgi:hypothetical protein
MEAKEVGQRVNILTADGSYLVWDAEGLFQPARLIYLMCRIAVLLGDLDIYLRILWPFGFFIYLFFLWSAGAFRLRTKHRILGNLIGCLPTEHATQVIMSGLPMSLSAEEALLAQQQNIANVR